MSPQLRRPAPVNQYRPEDFDRDTDLEAYEIDEVEFSPEVEDESY